MFIEVKRKLLRKLRSKIEEGGKDEKGIKDLGELRIGKEEKRRIVERRMLKKRDLKIERKDEIEGGGDEVIGEEDEDDRKMRIELKSIEGEII